MVRLGWGSGSAEWRSSAAGLRARALAAWLARAGRRRRVLHARQAPPIIVGESLVPAVMPFLRDLGIEDEVAAYSHLQARRDLPLPSRSSQMSFRFAEARGAKTPYSYNVPRDRFDASLRGGGRARGRGAHRRSPRSSSATGRRARPARAERRARAAGARRRSPTSSSTRAAARARSRGCSTSPTVEGPRKDTALHAHCTGVSWCCPGNVHTDRLERGWAGAFRCPGRVSVGLVIPSEHIATFGDNVEEQFDSFLRHDESARQWGDKAERITPVVSYTNYQLRRRAASARTGRWCGDAFGFIDPVLSSGLLIALDGARALADAILDGTARARFATFETRVIRKLDDWQRIVDAYYSGRLFTLFKVGEYMKQHLARRARPTATSASTFRASSRARRPTAATAWAWSTSC